MMCRYNYPVGAYNDPDAPYNQKDREVIPFEKELDGDCEMCDSEDVALNEKYICQDCYEQDPDYYEEYK